ncbi:efflux RND transporter periplasmic adaptor subunit [Rariglobus hedericola]|uniref:Efflux RND transporter periplasmic adaptor subunit n=1 Tax=Rariglobus hedericola TaxID=2597822 RepID=A0A556QLA3_9BACT|nr:efflux RND transporter periplasmic adaptor subunit [Rariglobus hedericola]TSJ77401.1 efflux RND transporter periplasmic adaptor subunit [Rariglobus hedericola]
MKLSAFTSALVLVTSLTSPLHAADSAARRANTVVLDETGVKNLRIQTVVVEPGDFEETTFALGRIEVYPGNRAVISSRIAGRAVEVRLKHDHAITKGDVAFVVESRQIGNPPPTIELTAPITGLVSSVNVVTGESVDPDKSLAEILDLTKVYALARVPEHLAGRLKRGQRAHITVAAASGETFPAELEHLGVLADPASGTVEAAFRVANPELKLRPGMRAEFSIVTARRADVTSIPRSALQGSPAARFVYVKDFDLPNAFVKTPVVIGESNDRSVEIISGLLPADEVVTQGAYSLAFAGGGTLSLKEALDAAHGHAHAADGSELKSGAATSDDDHGHAHDGDEHSDHHESPIWKILTGVFFVAFVVTLFAKKPSAKA